MLHNYGGMLHDFVNNIIIALVISFLARYYLGGTDKQINRLQILLDDLESNTKIVYGLHITHAFILSCFI